jgi:hypothetical protein
VPLAVTLLAVPHAAMKLGALWTHFCRYKSVSMELHRAKGLRRGLRPDTDAADYADAKAQFTEDNGMPALCCQCASTLVRNNGLDFPNSTVPITDSTF